MKRIKAATSVDFCFNLPMALFPMRQPRYELISVTPPIKRSGKINLVWPSPSTEPIKKASILVAIASVVKHR